MIHPTPTSYYLPNGGQMNDVFFRGGVTNSAKQKTVPCKPSPLQASQSIRWPNSMALPNCERNAQALNALQSQGNSWSNRDHLWAPLRTDEAVPENVEPFRQHSNQHYLHPRRRWTSQLLMLSKHHLHLEFADSRPLPFHIHLQPLGPNHQSQRRKARSAEAENLPLLKSVSGHRRTVQLHCVMQYTSISIHCMMNTTLLNMDYFRILQSSKYWIS